MYPDHLIALTQLTGLEALSHQTHVYFWFAITPAPSASLPNSRLEDEVAPAAPSRFPISGGVQITHMNILVDYIYIPPQQSQNPALWRSLDLMCVFWSAGLCAYVL